MTGFRGFCKKTGSIQFWAALNLSCAAPAQVQIRCDFNLSWLFRVIFNGYLISRKFGGSYFSNPNLSRQDGPELNPWRSEFEPPNSLRLKFRAAQISAQYDFHKKSVFLGDGWAKGKFFFFLHTHLISQDRCDENRKKKRSLRDACGSRRMMNIVCKKTRKKF